MVRSREDEIVEAYETWDDRSESVAELVERLRISKARLYQVLDRKGVVPKSRRSENVAGMSIDRGIMSEMANQALAFLVNQLTEARQELAAYRSTYGPLPGGKD